MFAPGAPARVEIRESQNRSETARPVNAARISSLFRPEHPNFHVRVRWQIRNPKSEIRFRPSGYATTFEYHLPMALAKLGILISGGGSNMKSIVAACEAGEVPGEVAVVISNRADAPGLAWAIEHGLAAALLPHSEFPDRETHDRAVVERLREAAVDWVCLAGYMRLLSAFFVDAFRHRILNIHPALLPSFPGLHGPRQAWEYGVKIAGCSVHFVDLELDHGPIVVQRPVPVLHDDDEDSLAARILEQEHVAYPEALRLVLGGSWRIDGRRVVVG
jgi:phosphoribosylglycinamide formyltransferase-1